MLCTYFLTNSPVSTAILLPLQISNFTHFFPRSYCLTRFRGRPKDDDGITELQYTSSVLRGVMDRQRQTEVTQN